MTARHSFIDRLERAANACAVEEAEFRQTMNASLAALAQARAFAHRRMNVMRSLFDTVGQAEEVETAVAAAIAALRNRLGWREDSDARSEVLERYAAVATAAFIATHEADVEAEAATAAEQELAAFEDWYLAARGKPFWVLFEHYMPETQLVDF